MPTPNSKDTSVISIRFIGGQLRHQNLPIYELGQVLVGVQRLFHKAYLAEHERLEKRAFPDKWERRTIALQIGSHEKRSDFYGLVPFVSDPTVIATFKHLAEFVMNGLASYAFKDLMNRLRTMEDTKHSIYIGSIHAEVVNIVDRIDGLGGCETIQIGCPQLGRNILELDKGTREYAHKVKGETFLGAVQTIAGEAYKLYPNVPMIEIRRNPGNKKCKLYLSNDDFNAIRYGQDRSPIITVVGRPRFRVGTERRSFDEFEVTKIVSIQSDNDVT